MVSMTNKTRPSIKSGTWNIPEHEIERNKLINKQTNIKNIYTKTENDTNYIMEKIKKISLSRIKEKSLFKNVLHPVTFM